MSKTKIKMKEARVVESVRREKGEVVECDSVLAASLIVAGRAEAVKAGKAEKVEEQVEETVAEEDGEA